MTALASVVVSYAQIKNPITENVKIYGSCTMCKKKIENAGNLKNVANVTWDDKTQLATLLYDTKKTNQNEIVKRIALAGYDSDTFLAPDKTYFKLDKCCQYDRPKKEIVNAATPKFEISGIKMTENQEPSQLNALFENYFVLKDALVKTDGNSASEKAKEMLSAINAVKMESLKTSEHLVWMKVVKDIKAATKSISENQDIEKQRNVFNSLSKGVYELIKVSKPSETVYYEYCPMKKMNWLSKENTIKNPYFGSMMLSCGSVVETIK